MLFLSANVLRLICCLRTDGRDVTSARTAGTRQEQAATARAQPQATVTGLRALTAADRRRVGATAQRAQEVSTVRMRQRLTIV